MTTDKDLGIRILSNDISATVENSSDDLEPLRITSVDLEQVNSQKRINLIQALKQLIQRISPRRNATQDEQESLNIRLLSPDISETIETPFISLPEDLLDQALQQLDLDHMTTDEIYKKQAEIITQLYKSVDFESPINFHNHGLQENPNNINSCTVRTVMNALQALYEDQQPLPVNEAVFLSRIPEYTGQPLEHYLDRNELSVGWIMPYLRHIGYESNSVSSLLDVINELKIGGVIICTYGGHARLVSSVYKQGNDIMFRLNDPLIKDVIELSIFDFANQLGRDFTRSSLFSVRVRER